MSAFTSKASGALEATGQTTWNEVGAPTSGSDTISIANGHVVTVNVNLTLGASGTPGSSNGIVINGTGELSIAAGVKLIVNDDCAVDGILRGAGDGTYSFGNVGSNQYRLWTTTVGVTTARVITTGTSGHPFTFMSEGTTKGVIRTFSNAANAYLGMTCDFTNFTGLGTSSVTFGNHAIYLNTNGANQEAHFHDCTFTSTGAVQVSTAAARDYSWQRVKFVTPLFSPSASPPGLYFPTTSASTGVRRIKNIDGRRVNIGFATSAKNLELDYCVFYQCDDSQNGFTDASPPTYRKNILLAPKANVASQFGIQGETISTVAYLGSIGTQIDNSILGGWPGNTGAGTITYDKFVLQHDMGTEETDFFNPPTITSTHGPFVYRISRWTVALNSRGLPAGNIVSSHGSSRTSLEMVHCTGGTHENVSPSGNAHFCFNHGTTYAGHASMVRECRYNIIWAPAAGATRMWVLLYYGLCSVALTTSAFYGTATSGSTTTCVETGKAFPTGGLQTFVTSGAILYMLTGLNAGLNRPVTANTATTITTTAFPLVNAVGDTYKVVVADTVDQTKVGYNAKFNVRNGTIFDATGQNGATFHGYEGMALTATSSLGVGDIDLGTGTNYLTAGPMFVDPTRGPINWASRNAVVLGLATPSDWLTATSYTIGDRVKAQTAAFFNNEVLWFRCFANKGSNSAAADKPGSGANWRLYWEPETVAVCADAAFADTRISDAALGLSNATYVEHIVAWTNEGYRSTNPLLALAPDGQSFGAVAASSGGGYWYFDFPRRIGRR